MSQLASPGRGRGAPTRALFGREPASVAIGASVASIWLAVLFTSVFAPDLVSGSEQEHIPLAAFGNWFWGVIATGFVVMARRPRAAGRDLEGALWLTFGMVVVVIWLVATLAGIFAPDFVTGDDPTRIPLAVIIGPFAATLATAFAALWIAGAEPDSGSGGPGG